MLFGTSLYRALLRECRILPDERLQTHYRDHVRSIFRDKVKVEPVAIARQAKQRNKLLRQLQAVNDGYLHALKRSIEHAYGRRGSFKHELLRPFTNPPSRRHDDYSFTPALGSLTSSSLSHLSRPTTSAHLSTPPKMSPRADPTSEEARLLGPMIPQRIQAVRRRYWHEQTSKVRPPLAVHVNTVAGNTIEDTLRAAQIGPVDVQRREDLLRELETKARVPESALPRLPRRLQSAEQRATKGSTPSLSPVGPARRAPLTSAPIASSKGHYPKTLSPRYLRRRFQDVLLRTPVMTITDRGTKQNMKDVPAEKKGNKANSKSARFDFKIALSPESRLAGSERIAEAPPDITEHLRQVAARNSKTGKTGKTGKTA